MSKTVLMWIGGLTIGILASRFHVGMLNSGLLTLLYCTLMLPLEDEQTRKRP